MPKILKHNFSISVSTFIDFLVVLDYLERQSFTIPFRAFEWAEAPELECTILACLLLNQWAGEVTKQVLVSRSTRCFFIRMLAALHPEDL